MEIRNLTLDSVFDIQRFESRRSVPRSSRFSFESAGERHLDVLIQGWPIIKPGMVVTVVLHIPGDWQSLAGWVNHQDGELVLPEPGRAIFLSIACIVGALWVYLLAFGQGGTAVGLGRYLSAAFIAALLFASILLVHRATNEQKASRTLQSLSAAAEHVRDLE